jgi:hypothetical protein
MSQSLTRQIVKHDPLSNADRMANCPSKPLGLI